MCADVKSVGPGSIRADWSIDADQRHGPIEGVSGQRPTVGIQENQLDFGSSGTGGGCDSQAAAGIGNRYGSLRTAPGRIGHPRLGPDGLHSRDATPLQAVELLPCVEHQIDSGGAPVGEQRRGLRRSGGRARRRGGPGRPDLGRAWGRGRLRGMRGELTGATAERQGEKQCAAGADVSALREQDRPRQSGAMVQVPEKWTPLSMKISGECRVPLTRAGT